ncbi:MAG TPA: hypothetical protein VLQ65_05505 [Saliniramus sp.]|nr:hypothetical protein [Saliniramus sp.]
MIANAIDLPGHSAVIREPAAALAPDSDLGERLVTVEVGMLSHAEIDEALARGEALTGELVRAGLASGALLVVKNVARLVGTTPPLQGATQVSTIFDHPEERRDKLRMRDCINGSLGPLTPLGERPRAEGRGTAERKNRA